MAAGAVIVYAPPATVQLLASLTVTEYETVPNPVWSSSVLPVFHRYVYGSVPPLTVTLMLPLFEVLHVGWVTTAAVAVMLRAAGWVTDTLSVSVHPLASVTVTVYGDPANVNPVIVLPETVAPPVLV